MKQTTLANFRREAKLSQKEVGERIGRSRDSVRRYEHMEVELPSSAISILAELYGKSEMEILRASLNPPPAPVKPGERSSSKTA